jgi:hypothetical protein
MDRWEHGWMIKWMDGWIDGCILLLLLPLLPLLLLFLLLLILLLPLLLLLLPLLLLLLLLLLLQGPKEYTQYDELSADYSSGHIHPGDLKTAVTEALNRILEPVRSHFASGEPKILLEKIKKFKVTR